MEQSITAERIFKDLLLVDQVRGKDATGVVWYSKKDTNNWLKINVNASDFLDHPDARKFFTGMNSSGVVIGHNRSKTIGANTSNNAHPFDVGTIIGVHNGTIRNKHAICTDGYKFDVDSEALITGIQEHGIDNVVSKAEGAFSVVYIDKEAKTVNFIRNPERPMWMLHATEKAVGNTKERNFIFFGSEVGMLLWAVSRHGFTLGEYKQTDPYEFYSFTLDNIKPKVRTLEKPIIPETKTYGYGWNDEYEYTPHYKKKFSRDLNIIPSKSTEVALIVPNDKIDDVLPFELKESTFLMDIKVPPETKRNFMRAWRQAHKNDVIHFKVSDMTAVGGEQWQIFGKLAGRKKEGLPIIVSSIMPDAIIRRGGADTIFRGNLTLKRVLDGGKSYEFIVGDVSALGHTEEYKGEMACV